MTKVNHEIFIVGSVGSGKTTMAKMALPALITRLQKKSCVCSVTINICHLFCFLFLLAVFKLKYRGSRLIGNYYLTIYYTNKNLFRKIIRIMIILDAVSIIVSSELKKLLCKLKCAGKDVILIFDEFIINAIADYMYFYLNVDNNIGRIMNLFYRIIFSYLIKRQTKSRTIVIFTRVPISVSIRVWHEREKTPVIDPVHIQMREVVTTLLLRDLKQRLGLPITVFEVVGNGPTEIITRVIRYIYHYYSDRKCTRFNEKAKLNTVSSSFSGCK